MCGANFVEPADANRVSLNGERAFILAASPECVMVQANPRALPGPAKITIENSSGDWASTTTLVSLHFDPPIPALVPEKRSKLALHVQGSSDQLRVQVENRTPGCLAVCERRYAEPGHLRRSRKIRRDCGRSHTRGRFFVSRQILPAPDAQSASRYLFAAAPWPRKTRNPASTATRTICKSIPMTQPRFRPTCRLWLRRRFPVISKPDRIGQSSVGVDNRTAGKGLSAAPRS